MQSAIVCVVGIVTRYTVSEAVPGIPGLGTLFCLNVSSSVLLKDYQESVKENTYKDIPSAYSL